MTTGRHHTWLVLLGLLAVPTAAAAESLVAQADLGQAGFQMHWAAQLPLADGDTIVAGYIRDEVLYVYSDRGTMFSVTKESGLIRWAHVVTKPNYTIFPPTHVITVDGAGPVVVPTPTEVFVFDRFTGRPLRSFRPHETLTSPIVAVDDIILAGATDNRFHAVRVNFRQNLEPLQLWEAATNGPITTRPLLFDGDQVLFASRGGTLYGCRVDDKQLRFSTPVGGSVLGDPAIDETGAYVASTDRSLYKVDTTSGDILWRVRFQSPLMTGPKVIDGAVLQICERDGMTAVEPNSGKIRWRQSDARAFVAHTLAGDVLLSNNHDLMIVDHESGTVLAVMPTTGVIGTVANTMSDAVFLLGTHGEVNALRLGDVPYLKKQQIIAARRRLNQRPVNVETTTNGKNPFRSSSDDRSRPDDPLRSKRDRG